MRLSSMIKVVEDKVVSTISVIKLDCVAAIDAIAANHAPKVEKKEETVTEEVK